MMLNKYENGAKRKLLIQYIFNRGVLLLSDPFWRHQSYTRLDHVMAWHIFGTNPLLTSMLICFELGLEINSSEQFINVNNF